MSTTLLQYRTAVAAAGFDSVANGAVLDAVNEARQAIVAERRWSWLEAVDNTTLVLAYDTPSIALSGITNLLYVDAVRIELGGTGYEIDHRYPQDLREYEHEDRTPGRPLYWTHAAGQIRVYPSPDQAYTVTVDYIKTITDLVNDADVDLDLPVEFKALVKWKAAQALAYRTRDSAAAQLAENNYERELRRRVRQDAVRQRQHSDQVRVTGIWGDRG